MTRIELSQADICDIKDAIDDPCLSDKLRPNRRRRPAGDSADDDDFHVNSIGLVENLSCGLLGVRAFRC